MNTVAVGVEEETKRESFDRPLGLGAYIAFALMIIVCGLAALVQDSPIRTINLVGIATMLFGFSLQGFANSRVGAYILGVTGMLSLPIGIPAVLIALEGLHGNAREQFFRTTKAEPVQRAFYSKHVPIFIGMGVLLFVIGIFSALTSSIGTSLSGGALLLFLGIMYSRRPSVAVHPSYLTLRPAIFREHYIAWNEIAFVENRADAVCVGFRNGREEVLISNKALNHDDSISLYSTIERARNAALEKLATV